MAIQFLVFYRPMFPLLSTSTAAAACTWIVRYHEKGMEMEDALSSFGIAGMRAILTRATTYGPIARAAATAPVTVLGIANLFLASFLCGLYILLPPVIITAILTALRRNLGVPRKANAEKDALSDFCSISGKVIVLYLTFILALGQSSK